MSKQKLPTNFFIYGGLIIGSYFIILAPILKKLGIIKPTESKPENDPFSGSAFLKFVPVGSTLLTYNSATNFANEIYNSFTLFGDNNGLVIGIFRILKTQAQVAYLSQRFFEIYKIDLYTYLKNGKQGIQHTYFSGLSDKDLITIKDLINKKPKYK